MLEHAKGLRTNTKKSIQITIAIPGCTEISCKIPNTKKEREKVDQFLQAWPTENKIENPSKNKSIPWEETAKERIAAYTKSGLALRGIRYREGLSQKELAKLCHISQENISKMEHGKRSIGKESAKKLAEALNTDYRVFISKDSSEKN